MAVVSIRGFRVWEQADMFGEVRKVLACQEPECGWMVNRPLAWLALENDAAAHRQEHQAAAK